MNAQRRDRVADEDDRVVGVAPSRYRPGSKRLKSPSLNHAKSNRETPETHMNRAIPRQSSSTIVTPVATCHAGGRGFESPLLPLTGHVA